jgi:hypothetical protein
MGNALKIAICPTSLRVSDAPNRRAVSSQLRFVALGLSPAVTE